MKPTHPRRPAFSLVELLVVIGVIAVLLGILLPTLANARRQASTAKCLSNVRNMQIAQLMYANQNNGFLVQAGLTHGSHAMDGDVGWIATLQSYYDTPLLLRCPSDDSPHWPGGEPVPQTGGRGFRRTTYGINNFLDRQMCPWGGPYVKLTQVRQSSAVVQFIEMTETGEFAGSDHPHVEGWAVAGAPDLTPALAARHLATALHGGSRGTWGARCNYGFLDGHAETLTLRDAFESFSRNKFDPQVAQ